MWKTMILDMATVNVFSLLWRAIVLVLGAYFSPRIFVWLRVVYHTIGRDVR